MKRMKLLVLMLCVLVVLSGCGGSSDEEEQTTAPASTQEETQEETQGETEEESKGGSGFMVPVATVPPSDSEETTQAPSDSEKSVPTETNQDAENPEADPNALPVDLAKSCIDKTVDELYAMVGEPDSSQYAPSCLGDGEDGELYYPDFTVYTYRENGVETVNAVE